MWETSISHDHEVDLRVIGTIRLKVGEKESIMSKSMQDREISALGVGISTRDSATSSLVEIPTPRVRFSYPAWTFIMDSYILCRGLMSEEDSLERSSSDNGVW